jgi:hypothetical protein
VRASSVFLYVKYRPTVGLRTPGHQGLGYHPRAPPADQDPPMKAPCHCLLWPNVTQKRLTNDRKSSILGVEAAIFFFKTHQRRWGASPPTCAVGV